jgi:hypothetical protein
MNRSFAEFACCRMALPIVCASLCGCGGGEPVTQSSLAQAKRTWQRAGIRDYDLEWTTSGVRASHYRVFVRSGKVKRIYSVLPGGHEKEMHPAEPGLYGVDGLLQIIEEELAQAKSAAPFGQPNGTRVLLRLTLDPNLGYPKAYRRDLPGTAQGVAIDVVRLDTQPPEAIPPPKP